MIRKSINWLNLCQIQGLSLQILNKLYLYSNESLTQKQSWRFCVYLHVSTCLRVWTSGCCLQIQPHKAFIVLCVSAAHAQLPVFFQQPLKNSSLSFMLNCISGISGRFRDSLMCCRTQYLSYWVLVLAIVGLFSSHQCTLRYLEK